jgi:septal ring factor EnvC (AmiA/AmiB activator)
LLGAGAVGTQGYATIRGGIAQGDSITAQAEGAEQRAHQRVSQQQLDELVTALKELGQSFQRAKQSLIDSQNEVANTNNMLVATLGR